MVVLFIYYSIEGGTKRGQMIFSLIFKGLLDNIASQNKLIQVMKKLLLLVILTSIFFNTKSQIALTTPVLSSPSDMNCIEIGSALTLEWETVSGATSYEINFYNNGSTNNTFTSSTNSFNGNTSNFPNWSTFFWRVKAVNQNDSSAWSEPFSFKAQNSCDDSQNGVILTQPENNITTALTSVFFDWEHYMFGSSNATEYILVIAKSSNLSDVQEYTINQGTSKTLYNLEPNTEYSWQVRAYYFGSYIERSQLRSFQTPSDVTTGIELNTNGGIKVFPNPAYDNIAVQGLKAKTEFTVTDLNGKTCLAGILSTQQANINITDLNKGLYILELLNEDTTTKRIKLIKSK